MRSDMKVHTKQMRVIILIQRRKIALAFIVPAERLQKRKREIEHRLFLIISSQEKQ